MPANAIQLSLLINLPDELQDNHTSSTDVEENTTELTVQNRLCHLERSKSFSAGLGILTGAGFGPQDLIQHKFSALT